MKVAVLGVVLGAALWAGGALAQPAPADMKPGLEATYMDGDFKHVGSMPQTAADVAKIAKKKGVVALLDDIGPEGEVLGSGRRELYGVYMTGFLKLPAGETTLVLNSNDGVRLTVNGRMVIEDGDVHADRMSMPAKVRQAQEGWVPVTLHFFQRRNTATLQLFWQPAGAKDMEIVPAAAFGHVPAK
jgi:hypothetical protein